MAVTEQKITERFALYNGDCCEVVPDLKTASVDFTIYSPPFADLYNYSSSDRDMSNCKDYTQFLEHYRFLVNQIARVTKPGRLSCVHCMDLKKNSNGGRRDFPGDIIRIHEDAGFDFASRRTIWKEPLRVAIRTRAKGLMHRQLVSDSTECCEAGGDYLLTFRRHGENKSPVTHETGLSHYAGEDTPPAELVAKYRDWTDQGTNRLSHWIWRRYASSVWMDIRIGRVLPYRKAREKEEEKHICPLQLDVIERAIVLSTNPGDVVLTPFLGIGSEAYVAVQLGRRAVGVELKPSYFRQAVRNLDGVGNESRDADMLDGFVETDPEEEEEGTDLEGAIT